jgi:putative intracellular protease/amidase
MSKGKVLIVCTNANRIEIRGGGTGPTGQYLNETVVPAMALAEAGYELVLATPAGTMPPIDPVSDVPEHFGGDAQVHRRARIFFDTDPAMNAPITLRAAIDQGLDRFAAVFVPGGQGPAVDLMQDSDLGEILRHFHKAGKPTALLCHGPIATLAALPEAKAYRAALIAGEEAGAAALARDWQYGGYRMTVFSGPEEKPIEDNVLHGKLYFHMPYALALAGGDVSQSPVDFEPHVVEDRELITGQNPRSDHPIAARLIAALERAMAPA